MSDRHLIGDVAIACLLAIPTVAFSRPQPTLHAKTAVTSPLIAKAAYAERTPVEKQVSLPARS